MVQTFYKLARDRPGAWPSQGPAKATAAGAKRQRNRVNCLVSARRLAQVNCLVSARRLAQANCLVSDAQGEQQARQRKPRKRQNA